MLPAIPIPVVTHPPRDTPMERSLCQHLGGTHGCRNVTATCLGCGIVFVYCAADTPPPRVSVAGTTGSLTTGPLCPSCATLQQNGSLACSLCHRLVCRCTQSVVSAYHASRPAWLWSVPSGSDPWIGLELEAIYTPTDTGTIPERAIANAFAPIAGIVVAHERDSSLGVLGVETVTAPLPLTLLRDAIPSALEAIATAGGSCASDRCGGHVHLTRSPRTYSGADRIWRTYGTPAQAPVWEAIAGRTIGAYPSAGWASGTLPAHRAALWAGTRTLEWRHPGGTDDPRVLLGRVEVLLDAIDHAASLPEGQPWGWGRYLRDRPDPTPTTRYGWALLHSIGLY